MPTSPDLPVVAALTIDSSLLETVTVVTLQGAEYSYPDMDRKSVALALPPSGRIPESVTHLMLFNYSAAMLSVPFRIVREVRVGEEVLWKCPA